jgi:hypothetical protein
MASEITAVVYDGVSYPITDETGRSLIEFVSGFELVAGTGFIEVPTTDGRRVILNLGPSLAVAFEAKPIE